jgi:hypothetical protein
MPASQAGRRRFDPGRPLHLSAEKFVPVVPAVQMVQTVKAELIDFFRAQWKRSEK